MTYMAGKASKDDPPTLHAAIGLASQMRLAREEIEQGRRIPTPLAVSMKEAGIFGMVMPRTWGGPELDPMTQFRVLAGDEGNLSDAGRLFEDAFHAALRYPPSRTNSGQPVDDNLLTIRKNYEIYLHKPFPFRLPNGKPG